MKISKAEKKRLREFRNKRKNTRSVKVDFAVSKKNDKDGNQKYRKK